MNLEEKELKKFIHPDKGIIIALNYDKEHLETTYYQLHPNADVPYSLEDVETRKLRKTIVRNKALLRSLNYPNIRQTQEVKASK